MAGCGSTTTGSPAPAPPSHETTSTPGEVATTSSPTPTRTAPAKPAPHPPFATAERTFVFVDPSRTVTYPRGGTAPRRLVTVVRYPLAPGGFPLVVFGHGFAVTPAIYSRLLERWAQAGYVVAAPVFPLGNADAPGGPDERDLVNQPGDMSFVISRLLAMSRRPGGVMRGRIDPGRVAVSGQSDGGDTALSVAYDDRWRDRRIDAVVVLSGAEIPGVTGYTFRAAEPALLAVQGLADPINPPALTYTFFAAARPPKYLLTLAGASHLGPYTGSQPDLGIVERVSTAFLDLYLKRLPGARARMLSAARAPGAVFMSQP